MEGGLLRRQKPCGDASFGDENKSSPRSRALRVGSSRLLSSWRGQPVTCVSLDPVEMLARRGGSLRVIAVSTVEKPGPHTED